jgi:prepilin-type N-terminal cleavage/methylation domain-containing protein
MATARAFTMIELIVVVVILAIAAVMVVPRFSGTARQDADNGIERVAELVRLFAYREAMGSQQVALWRDGTDGRIHLLVKDRDPAAEGEAPDWRPDRFAAPVTLPDGVEVAEVRVDDARVDPLEWLVASVPGGDRPKVEIRLVGHGLDSTVSLPTGSPSAVRVDVDKPLPFARFPIDLERQGRGDEPW